MSEEIKSLGDLEAVAGGAEAVVEIAAPREPVRDELGRSYATGKRKDAVARVWIKPGSGKVTINGKEMNAYFARPVLQMIAPKNKMINHRMAMCVTHYFFLFWQEKTKLPLMMDLPITRNRGRVIKPHRPDLICR